MRKEAAPRFGVPSEGSNRRRAVVPRGTKSDHPLTIVEGVTLNGRPLGVVRSRCSICSREQGSQPGFVLYESDVECVERAS